MKDNIVVLMTAPSADKAAEIARALVEAKLAACVNIVPGVRSIYAWQGKLCDEAEVLCVIKTRRQAFEPLKDKVISLHPYSVPEIIAVSITEGNEPYLRWIGESVWGFAR